MRIFSSYFFLFSVSSKAAGTSLILVYIQLPRDLQRLEGLQLLSKTTAAAAAAAATTASFISLYPVKT